jgi:formylglycine-generating enzyme required for sulfatase activity
MKAAGESKYPWGSEEPGLNRCNYSPTWNNRGEDGFPFLAPVGSFPQGASAYGCMDMAGNVCEWVEGGKILGGSWCHGAAGCTVAVSLEKFHAYCFRNGCDVIGARLVVSEK